MRVLLVCSQYPFTRPLQVGGGGSHVFYLALSLAEIGVKVTILTCKGAFKAASPLEQFDGVNVVPCINPKAVSKPDVIECVLRESQSPRPDVVHGHHFDGGTLAQLIASAYDLPMILTMHKPPKSTVEADSASPPKYTRSAQDALWRQFATDKRVKAHIAYSKVYLKENKEIGVPARRIRMVLHGVPIAFLRRKAGESHLRSKRLEIPSNTTVILCPLRPEKRGVRTFLEAANAIRGSLGTKRLLFIVTGDPKKGGIEARRSAQRNVAYARDMGLDEQLMLFRTYSLRQMWGVMKRAAVCVLPSEIEGLSLTALEAMAIGTPLVASEVPGISEVVVDGQTGLLAEHGKAGDFAKKVIQVLSKNDLAQQLVAGASKRVEERFSADRMAREHLAIYKEFVVSS